MPTTWFEPHFIYQISYDLGTYFILSLIFVFLCRKKIINYNLLILSLLLLLMPFVFNGFLFNWDMMPDQSKYLLYAERIRGDLMMVFHRESAVGDLFGDIGAIETNQVYVVPHKVFTPSILYAFSPIISLETYKGIALVNRAIFLLTWIFLIKKKYLDEYSSIFFILVPSLILYSSVALRDILIFLLMIWFIYFYYEKKIIANIFVVFILYVVKFQMLFTIGTFVILNFIIKKDNINTLVLFYTILVLSIFTYFTGNFILETVNGLRLGFFVEEYGGYRSMSATKNFKYFKIEPNLESLQIVWWSFYNFILPPVLNGKHSIFAYAHIIEVFFITSYLSIRIRLDKNFNLNTFIKWFLILIISYFIFSTVVFNTGTALRYKFPVMCFVIIGYFINTGINKKLIKNR